MDGCMVRFRSTDIINSIVSILDGPGTRWSICIFLEYRQVRLIFEFKMAHLYAYGSIYVLRKGVLGLFRTTYPAPYVSTFLYFWTTYPPLVNVVCERPLKLEDENVWTK